MKNVSLCNDQCWSVCGKTFKVAVFSDTINMINVKFCMMVLLIELYPFTSLSVILIDRISRSQQCQTLLTEILCSYSIKLKLCMIVNYVKQIINIPLFYFFAHVQGR